MLFVEYVNGYNLYLYNNGTAVAISGLSGEVTFFMCYDYAYMWALPF